MDMLFKIIGFLSIPLLIFSIFMMVRSLKKERTITIRSLLLQVVISIVMLIIYSALLNIAAPTAWSWALIAVGLLVGGLQSRTTALTVQGDRVLGKRAVWFLVVWGAAFTITQLLALFARGGMASYGLLTIYFATGLSIGANLGLFLRRQQVLSRGGTPSATPACPGCGAQIQPGISFCTSCGAELVPAPVEARLCPACGAAAAPGQRFCTGCGNPLD